VRRPGEAHQRMVKEILGEKAAARGRALRLRTYLLIQREVMGLRRHAVVDAQYPEPPVLTESDG